ncbi:MAG: hypothetical protein EZS28_002234 [Streblomastix strix]|uniref:B30.2/SPRY domain-containing protein n=1 Tax=Streblomastix strix TaxID=222440 RepID=A0A5J4X4T9_9EUKA|nr:MAG: hypothetical protein EZS28_002234 [Streblomastix strix]
MAQFSAKLFHDGPLNVNIEKIDNSPSSPQLKKTHSRSPPAPTQLIKIPPSPIIPLLTDTHWEVNKLIHASDNENLSTCLFDPVITEGIVRFEGIFENKNKWYFCIGIADPTAVYSPGTWPQTHENDKKSVRHEFWGSISHIEQGRIGQRNDMIEGNSSFKSGQRVGCEINMSSNPRKAHFFVDGVEQPLSVFNIPPAVRFMAFLEEANCSFTVTRFESLTSSSVHGVPGSKQFEWGKQWKKDQENAFEEELFGRQKDDLINFVEGF